MVVCKEVIITELSRRGDGGQNSPIRILTQIYDKSGKLIAEADPCGGYTMEDMLSFAEFSATKKGTLKDWESGNRQAS